MDPIHPLATPLDQQKPPAITPKSFSQVDFLKVIVTQLTQQDPFKAGDSNKIIEDFMNMANFQAVQESTATSKSMKQLDQYGLARNLLGTAVEVQGSEGTLIQGFVQRVRLGEGGLIVTVNNVEYPLDRVVTMNNTPAAPLTTQP